MNHPTVAYGALLVLREPKRVLEMFPWARLRYAKSFRGVGGGLSKWDIVAPHGRRRGIDYADILK